MRWSLVQIQVGPTPGLSMSLNRLRRNIERSFLLKGLELAVIKENPGIALWAVCRLVSTP